MDRPAVLVVEDELNIQQTLSVVLTLVGFKAHCAANVDEALDVLQREHIDAVSLDVRLPDPQGQDRNGLTLLQQLRTLPGYGAVPVLLFTGVELNADEEQLVATHRAKVFYKPQPYAQIIDALNRALARVA